MSYKTISLIKTFTKKVIDLTIVFIVCKTNVKNMFKFRQKNIIKIHVAGKVKARMPIPNDIIFQ